MLSTAVTSAKFEPQNHTLKVTAPCISSRKTNSCKQHCGFEFVDANWLFEVPDQYMEALTAKKRQEQSLHANLSWVFHGSPHRPLQLPIGSLPHAAARKQNPFRFDGYMYLPLLVAASRTSSTVKPCRSRSVALG